MSIFTSQFDRARRYSEEYAGGSGEARFWTPAAIAAGVGVAGAALLIAASGDDAATGDDAWGEAAPPPADDAGTQDGPWSVHSDWTDASVGGDGDFMYFSDGDTSFTVG